MRRRLRGYSAVILAAVALALSGSILAEQWHYLSGQRDFAAFYLAGRAVLQGEASHLYDLDYLTRHSGLFAPFLYLPAFAVPFAPLALLPLPHALALFSVLALACLVVAVRLAAAVGRVDWRIPAALLLLCGPAYVTVLLGQVSPFLLVAALAVALRIQQGRDGVGAGLLAGVLFLKPYLLAPLVVFWLVRRRWRGLAGLAAAGVGLAVVSLALSPAACLGYLQSRLQVLPAVMATVEQKGINPTVYSQLIRLVPGQAAALAAVTALLVLGVTALLHRDISGRYNQAALWLAPLVMTPYLGTYDLVLALVPVATLLPLWRRDRVIALACLAWWVALGLLLVKLMLPAVVCAAALFVLCAWQALGAQAPAGKTAPIRPEAG